MRVLIACAILISTALGLAGCFHHPTGRCCAADASTAPQITSGACFSCDYLSYKCQGSVEYHSSEPS